MGLWIRSGESEWWVGRNPPPVVTVGNRELISEVRCHDLHNAIQLIWRIFDDDSGRQTGRLMHDESRSYALRQISPVERRRHVAWMIVGRRLRVWRRAVWPTITVGLGGASSLPSARSLSPPPSKPQTATATAAPASLPRSPSPTPTLATVATPPLFWYEFILKDELGEGLPGVEVEVTTPAGRRSLRTDDAGSVRVDQVPAGRGAAQIDVQSLALALENRAERPRRRSIPLKETADFEVVTPGRAGRLFSFPHEQPHRVMVVSRTDVVVAGSDARWCDLGLADESKASCRFAPGELDLLHLCSRGQGELGQVDGGGPPDVEPPPDAAAAAARASATQAAYVVKPGDSFWRIAEKMLGDGRRWPEIRDANADLMKNRPPNLIHPGDIVHIPVKPAVGLIPVPGPLPPGPDTPPSPFIAVEVDLLHEALFDQVGQRMFDIVAGPLVRLPAPPEPSSDPPESAAAAAAVLASVVALERGVAPEELFRPLELQLFDPVERAGPPKR